MGLPPFTRVLQPLSLACVLTASTHLRAAQQVGIPIGSVMPPEHRVIPMPVQDRIRLHAVPERGMCSIVPATTESNGLFSGNGIMNISVFGDPFAEQVTFHNDLLLQPWRTGKNPEAPDIAYVLPDVRKLMLDGQYRKALDLSLDAAAKAGVPQGTGNLEAHPAFIMRINTANRHEVTDYLRTVDFETGEAAVRWKDSSGVWERRSFVSKPDNVVVQSITAPPASVLDVDIQLDTSMVLRPPRSPGSQIPAVAGPYRQHAVAQQPGAGEIQFTRRFTQSDLILEGRYVVDAGNPGYASVTRVVAVGGQLTPARDTLQVRGAHSLLLLTRIEVYGGFTQAAVDALKTAVNAVPTDYSALLANHRRGQSEVIDRVSVDFGGGPMHSLSGEEMLTDERTRQGFNPALLENLFDMGRYWLYGRTGKFPPMWGHININVNLQIASAAMANLPETTDALVRWAEFLLPDSRVNARNIFGARGVLFSIHPTPAGGALTHFEFTWPHHYWISGAGWLYSPIWDHYLVTGDREFLRYHLLPQLKEIAVFYEDYLKETDATGHSIFLPSYSPENWPSNSDGSPSVINADMDIAVCREVLTHLITAAQTLGVESENVPKWQGMLAKLPPYYLDSDGSLKEWAWPTLEERLDHRHLSHMYGVWPSDEITPDQTPELARAAWLAARKRAQGNASAHGIFHRAFSAARLKDSWLVTFDLKQILEQGYINPSLTTMHNPYALPSPDPQGALPALLIEMLVYSRPGVVELLPAIPESLRKGSARGILCRTDTKIEDLTWDLDAKKADVTLSSPADQDLSLVMRDGIDAAKSDRPEALSGFHPGMDAVNVHLTAGTPLTIHLRLGNRLPSDWITGK